MLKSKIGARPSARSRAFCVAIPEFGMEIRKRMFHAAGKPRKEGWTSPYRRKSPMKRRDFIKVTGIGAVAGAATIAAPAIAQSMPELKWRMPTSWPKSLDTLYGGAEMMCQVRRRSHRQQVSDSAVRGRRDCARTAGGRRRAERHRRDRPHRFLLLLRQGSRPSRSAPRSRSVPTSVSIRVGTRSAAARKCSTSSTRNTTASRCSPAIPAVRWAAGSARRSTPSTI